MAGLSDADRQALQDELKSIKDSRAWWGIVASAASIPSGFVLPALIPAFLGVGGVMAGILTIEQNAVEHKLADPPRMDYATRTRARSRRYWPGSLGDSQLARATDEAALATLRVAAYLDASVRADERAQGAELHGEDELAEARLEEANRLMAQARAAEEVQAVQLNALSMAWAAVVADERLGGVPIPLPDDRFELPARVRRAMRRAGLALDKLDLSIDPPPRDDSFEGAAYGPRFGLLLDVSLAAAEGTRELARAVAGGAARSGDRVTQVEVRSGRGRVPEEYELAVRALERHDFDRAEELLRRAAERGSPDAMFELGRLARRREDLDAARRWFALAADRNPPRHRSEWFAAMPELDPSELRSLPSPPEELEEPEES